MNKQQYTPNSLLNNSKDNVKEPQIKTIFKFLQNNTATASMVSAETGIPQKNICRFKRDLEKSGKLWEVSKGKCKHTGFKAWYLTTTPEKAPKQSNAQLLLF